MSDTIDSSTPTPPGQGYVYIAPISSMIQNFTSYGALPPAQYNKFLSENGVLGQGSSYYLRVTYVNRIVSAAGGMLVWQWFGTIQALQLQPGQEYDVAWATPGTQVLSAGIPWNGTESVTNTVTDLMWYGV